MSDQPHSDRTHSDRTHSDQPHSDRPEMDCSRALARMHEFLDHELADADADEIREHLAACEPCLDDFDADQALKQLVHRCCSNDRAPQELRQRILTSLEQRRREGR